MSLFSCLQAHLFLSKPINRTDVNIPTKHCKPLQGTQAYYIRCVFSLSRQYSRYRSTQRALARQAYLRKHLKLPFRRTKPARLTRPVRPRQRSYYARRMRPDSLGLEEYDRSIIHPLKTGAVSKHGAKSV